MGRSVWTHSDAVATVFRVIDGYDWICRDPDCETERSDDETECLACGASLYDETGDSQQFEFDCLVEDIRESFKQRFPSMGYCDHWPECESHAIVENDHCMVVISEYCGLVSIGVVPHEREYYSLGRDQLARAWTETHAAPFLRETFGELRKIATASNGEAFYERV